MILEVRLKMSEFSIIQLTELLAVTSELEVKLDNATTQIASLKDVLKAAQTKNDFKDFDHVAFRADIRTRASEENEKLREMNEVQASKITELMVESVELKELREKFNELNLKMLEKELELRTQSGSHAAETARLEEEIKTRVLEVKQDVAAAQELVKTKLQPALIQNKNLTDIVNSVREENKNLQKKLDEINSKPSEYAGIKSVEDKDYDDLIVLMNKLFVKLKLSEIPPRVAAVTSEYPEAVVKTAVTTRADQLEAIKKSIDGFDKFKKIKPRRVSDLFGSPPQSPPSTPSSSGEPSPPESPTGVRKK